MKEKEEKIIKKESNRELNRTDKEKERKEKTGGKGIKDERKNKRTRETAPDDSGSVGNGSNLYTRDSVWSRNK